MKILFTGVGRRIELIKAFRSAALILNKELKIYGAEMTDTAPALAFCDYTRKVPAMRDPGYIGSLLEICKADGIDLIIPTIDTDLLVLSENKSRFEEAGTAVMISSPDMIKICRDKNLTGSFFRECGLSAPVSVNDYTQYNGGFPAFIKPKDGSSSVNAFRANNEEELGLYASKIGDYVIQPFVGGREFTIDILCDREGAPLSIVPRERLQVRAGEVLKTRIAMDAVMIKEAEAICRSFRPCGPITVQLIQDGNGVNHYIEINPRFGGGAPLSMKAGSGSAIAVLKMYDGDAPGYSRNIEDGAVYSRFDDSVCVSDGKCEPEGIIFDLDDTLYSEIEYVKSGFRAVSDYLGGGYEDKLLGYFEARQPAIDSLLKFLGRESEKAKVLEIYRTQTPDIHLFDGVEDVIEKLRAGGKKIGIITDGRPEGQHKKIKALGLDRLVDDIIVTDELGGAQFRKPCDIAFRIMLTRWKIVPSRAVYVGDNCAKDFQAPRQLGMKTVLIKNSGGLYPIPPDAEGIEKITDLLL